MSRFKVQEIENFQFFMMPKALFRYKKYKVLSAKAKIAYTFFLDKLHLSKRNGWIDENGEIYFYYSQEQLAEDLADGKKESIHRSTASEVCKELKEVGLLDDVRTIRGKKYYLHKIEAPETQDGVLEEKELDNPEDDEITRYNKMVEAEEKAEIKSETLRKNNQTVFARSETTDGFFADDSNVEKTDMGCSKYPTSFAGDIPCRQNPTSYVEKTDMPCREKLTSYVEKTDMGCSEYLTSEPHVGKSRQGMSEISDINNTITSNTKTNLKGENTGSNDSSSTRARVTESEIVREGYKNETDILKNDAGAKVLLKMILKYGPEKVNQVIEQSISKSRPPQKTRQNTEQWIDNLLASIIQEDVEAASGSETG